MKTRWLAQTKPVLKRYKFTLLYCLVFGMLGGLVLAIPALLGGIIIDKLMMRPNPRAGFPVTKYTTGFYLLFLVWLMIFYPLFLFGWVLDFLQPFTDKMALYIPAVDRYQELVTKLGHEERAPKVAHLIAAYWFWGIIIAPLWYGDIVRWTKQYRHNNFYAHLRAEEMPDRDHSTSLNPDIPRDILIGCIGGLVALSGCVLALIFIVPDSFFGPKELSQFIYNSPRSFTWYPLLVLTLPGTVIFLFLCLAFAIIRYNRRKKSNLV